MSPRPARPPSTSCAHSAARPSRSSYRSTPPAGRLLISQVEGAAFHEQWLREHPERYSDEIRGKVEPGLTRLAIDYIRDLEKRLAIEREALAVLGTVDLLVSPTLPRTVPTVAEGDPGSRLASYTRAYNISGLPAISVPCGLDDARGCRSG